MARARNIKPGFFKNELLAEMPAEIRLLFMGLWCLADREGRFEDRPKKIKMELFPCDDFSIEDGLCRLAKDGFLIRYEVDGKKYAQVVNFTKHQMPHHKEVQSEIPAPPGLPQVTKHSYDVSKEVRESIFLRDGHACLKCGSRDSISLDHIIPLASGGDNSTSNLQTLCKSCNSSKGGTTKDYRKTVIDPSLAQRCGNDGAHCPSDSLIPDSGFLIPDPLRNAGEPAAEPDKPTRPSRGGKTLKTYLAECREAGIKPIPDSHYVRAYIRDAGITEDMAAIAWLRFREDHTIGTRKDKRYSDWPAVFANSVKDRWYRLWTVSTEGDARWTNEGLQARRVADAQQREEVPA